MKRRGLLQALGAGTALAACSREPDMRAPVDYRVGGRVPWINWAGNQSCWPSERIAPQAETELVERLRAAKGVVRAVGAGHSFTAVVPTDDTLIATDLLAGLASVDSNTLQAEVWAGTRLHAMGDLLEPAGQALPNMPDMNYLALGGAMANAAHATGAGFGSMPSYVAGITLATPSGELISCDVRRNPELFQAARVSLGVLGIVTRMRLQNQAPFRLTETDRIEKTEDVLADLANRKARHRHFEFLPLPYSSYSITVSTDVAVAGDADLGEDDPQAAMSLRKVFEALSWIPGGRALYDRVLTTVFGSQATTVRTGRSYEVFPHVRIVRFREMEYSIPADAAVACVREVLQAIRTRNLPVCMPLEVRFIRADGAWMSMFEGRDSCSISVHQYADLDHRAYFGEIEPIFWKYEGRPHWGKLHTLDAPRLAKLYERHWRDFQEIRASVDPQGRMLNPYLKSVLGA